MSSKLEITAANFPALHTFLRGYFHEDVADVYGTPPEAADQLCGDADTDERIPVAREWQQVVELPGTQPVPLNAAVNKLGSPLRLAEEDIPQIGELWLWLLAAQP